MSLPACECGYCHGPDTPLPMAAWSVAGHGDLDRLAVHEDHVHNYEGGGYVIERYKGWAAVGEAGGDE